MTSQDVMSPCSTSGRSEGQLSSQAGRCPVFEGLYNASKPGQELVRLWHGSEQDFGAAFELGELVGEGGFAVVRRGRCPESGEDVAVKIVDRQRYGKQHTQNLDREIAILQQLDHPHLVRLKRVYLSPPRVYIVTELLTGGELLDALTVCGKYPEPDARRMMEQLLQAVDYLHSHGIAHRDLKLENLLLATHAPAAPLKIADFGLSKSFLEDPLRTICGSPQYVAPEVLCVGLLRASYGCAADLWSLGVVLFILLAGFSPFDDDSEALMFERIRAGRYSVEGPLWEGVSQPARDLVRQLLCVDPKRRLTAAQALQHPWICEQHVPSSSPEGASPEAATRPKMSPRRPTIKGLDKLVLQSRSPNQSAPDSPRGSPRHEPPVSPGPGSPAKGKPGSSSPRCKGDPRDDKAGGVTGRLPASPRSPAPSSPLSRRWDSSDGAHQAIREVKRVGTPKALLAQIGKLLR